MTNWQHRGKSGNEGCFFFIETRNIWAILPQFLLHLFYLIGSSLVWLVGRFEIQSSWSLYLASTLRIAVETECSSTTAVALSRCTRRSDLKLKEECKFHTCTIISMCVCVFVSVYVAYLCVYECMICVFINIRIQCRYVCMFVVAFLCMYLCI